MGLDIYEKIKDKIFHTLVKSDMKFSFGNGPVVTASIRMDCYLVLYGVQTLIEVYI